MLQGKAENWPSERNLSELSVEFKIDIVGNASDGKGLDPDSYIDHEGSDHEYEKERNDYDNEEERFF